MLLSLIWNTQTALIPEGVVAATSLVEGISKLWVWFRLVHRTSDAYVVASVKFLMITGI